MKKKKRIHITDILWQKIEALLPAEPLKSRGGRPRADARQIMRAIFFVLYTGCQWKALPPSMGASSTVYDRFREWAAAGVFEALWKQGLLQYNQKKGIKWSWLSVDGCITKAPLGGESVGPNPTDRAKSGTKRSILVDERGIPLAITVAGANRHDMKLLKSTIEIIAVKRPAPSIMPQNLCLDKGYDYPEIYRLVKRRGYIPHIVSRGTEQVLIKTKKKYRPRRWVVERTHSWLNRFRRLLIRWEKLDTHYLAFLHFACAIVSWRAAGVFG